MELTLYMGGVSTPPVYRGSFGGNRWIGFPPKPPPTWGGGTYRGQGTVGGNRLLYVAIKQQYKMCTYSVTAKANPVSVSIRFILLEDMIEE